MRSVAPLRQLTRFPPVLLAEEHSVRYRVRRGLLMRVRSWPALELEVEFSSEARLVVLRLQRVWALPALYTDFSPLLDVVLNVVDAAMIRVRDWPRGWRVAIYWGASVLALAVLLPATLAVAYLLGFGACDRPDTAATAPVCSPLGLLSLSVVLIAGVLILYLPWVRFLQHQLNIDSKLQPSPYKSSPLPAAVGDKRMSLPFGQELVVGRIDLCDRSGRTILFEGSALTLWSLYPFQKGWIKQGDRLVLVYQTIPFSKSLQLALAFWNGSPNPVRGVAAITQSVSILIAAACVGIFTTVPAPLPGLWITVCVLVAVMSSAYLALMLRAKAVLRKFIADLDGVP